MKELEEIISGIENVNELTFYNLPVLPVKQLLEERENLIEWLEREMNIIKKLYDIDPSNYRLGSYNAFDVILDKIKVGR